MDILDVNEYLNAASDALQDDPEYFHWIQALGNARKQALDECDCYTDKVEGCLWQVYVRQVKYILENIDKIDKAIAEAEREFSETGEYADAKEAFNELQDEYDIDALNPRPNPYAKELVKKLDEADRCAAENGERLSHDDVFAPARRRIADIVNKGIDDYEAGKTVPGKETLQKLRDKYSETPITDSLTGIISEKCSETKVTFRQIVEKTVSVDGSDMATIYKNIEALKDNPDEIDFDKDCDSVVIEARVNL